MHRCSLEQRHPGMYDSKPIAVFGHIAMPDQAWPRWADRLAFKNSPRPDEALVTCKPYLVGGIVSLGRTESSRVPIPGPLDGTRSSP